VNRTANVLEAAQAQAPIAVSAWTDREEVARLLSKYNLLAVPVVADGGEVLGIVTVDDVIDAIIAEGTEDVQKFGGSQALEEAYVSVGLCDHDPQAGGLVVRPLSVGNADRECHAGLSGRDRKSRRPHLFNSTHYELGRQFGLAGNLARNPGAGAARNRPWGLVGALPRASSRLGSRWEQFSASSAWPASCSGRTWGFTTTASIGGSWR
jgi:hypothetical protein